MGCRRLYALISNLPPDAALWRTQARIENEEPPQKIKTTDPNQIAAFFDRLAG